MPDMSLPGAHLRACLDRFEYKAVCCRDAARVNTIRAEIYEEAKLYLKDAMDNEALKSNDAKNHEHKEALSRFRSFGDAQGESFT